MRDHRPSEALYEMLEEVGGASGLDQTMAVLERCLRRLLEFDAMALFLLSGGELTPAYVMRAETEGARELLPPGQAVADAVAETRRPAFNRYPGGAPGAKPGYRSMLAVPLEDGEELEGVLALYSGIAGAFRPEDLGVLLWIRADLAHAIRHCVHAGLPDPVLFDCLTGLPNERSLFPRLDDELARCRRLHESLAVLLCVVDGTTEAQARYGLMARDRLTQSVAAALRRLFPDPDWVARFGEEFAMMQHATVRAELVSKPAVISALIKGIGIAHLGESVLSVRVGAALYPDDGPSTERLLAIAAERQNAVDDTPDSFGRDLARLGDAVDVQQTEPEGVFAGSSV